MSATSAADRTLNDALDRSARSSPATASVGLAGSPVSFGYSEMTAAVDDVGRELRRSGVRRGDTVAIFGDNSMESVLSILGAMAIGAAAAPLDPRATTARTVASLKLIDPAVLLVPERLAERLSLPADPALPPTRMARLRMPAGDAAGGLDLRGPDLALTASAAADEPVGVDDVALILLTSGTTAVPKAVPLTHRNVLASIDGIVATCRLEPTDRTLLVMPLHHGHGLIAGLLATLAAGGSVHLPRKGRFSASSFWTDMTAIRATWYTAVPTIHRIVLERARQDQVAPPSTLRFVRSCSAPMSAAVLSELRTALGVPVVEAYGMTETAHQATSNPLPGDGRVKDATVGLPTGGLRVRIVPPDGRPMAAGIEGEVQVSGPALMKGYLGMADDEAEFSQGWFRTGDIGSLDGDGYLSIRGRIKNLINRGGEKISPSAVDAVLLSQPDVASAGTFGVSDARFGESVEAAVVLEAGHHVTEQDLIEFCVATLNRFEVPTAVHILEELPLTAKGDVDRRRLSEMYEPTEERSEGHDA